MKSYFPQAKIITFHEGRPIGPDAVRIYPVGNFTYVMDTLTVLVALAGTELLSESRAQEVPEQADKYSYSIPVGEGITYRVQIMAVSSPVPREQHISYFGGVPGLYEYEEDGMCKYASESVATIEEALQLKEQLRALGFQSAFIIAFLEGKRVR